MLKSPNVTTLKPRHTSASYRKSSWRASCQAISGTLGMGAGDWEEARRALGSPRRTRVVWALQRGQRASSDAACHEIIHFWQQARFHNWYFEYGRKVSPWKVSRISSPNLDSVCLFGPDEPNQINETISEWRENINKECQTKSGNVTA